MMKIKRTLVLILIVTLSLPLLGRSSLPVSDELEHVRAFTRNIEFDYIAWTLDALCSKLEQAVLNIPHYLPEDRQQTLVREYFNLVGQIRDVNAQITRVYADPQVENPEIEAAPLIQKRNQLNAQLKQISSLVETILQNQVSTIIAGQELSLGGQPVPPVLYHVTPLPLALIISPRDVIRQDEDISLLPDLTVEQMDLLEREVSKRLNVSALVVPVGGVGVYPTMVMQTSYLDSAVEVVSHEWTHNFLTLRPLGINYMTSPELRTMNETTASISGNELGMEVLNRYYPDLVPPPQPKDSASQPSPDPVSPPKFNFQSEMHQTRVQVDALLANGKIDEAESYMNARAQVFLDHGYVIRKLNQAYFAFNGAYADTPMGAAGQDPVGPAVRKLRESSPSLVDFLNRISWMSSFDELQKAIN